MRLGLSMVVKNEAGRLSDYLADIQDLFDDIVVVDTGSTDDTIAMLRGRFGAHVISSSPPTDDHYVITDARNLSLSENLADWILVLDADEHMSRDCVQKIKRAIHQGNSAYFLVWRNTRPNITFDDYKLALFRNHIGIHFEGQVHSNPQRSARRVRIDATLLEDVVIRHCLAEATPNRACRKGRLEHYVKQDPTWWRYQWFLGYTYFKERDFERAVPLLRDTCNSLSTDFPVECLNAHLVLTDINARKGLNDKIVRILRQAASFYESVKDDFEVKSNRELPSWITAAQACADRNELEKIRSYEFAY